MRQEAVYVVGVTSTSGGQLGVQFVRHPLAGAASISGYDDFDNERMAETRHWRFVWPSGVEVEFTAATRRRGMWETGSDSADGVARYMANALGWPISSAD